MMLCLFAPVRQSTLYRSTPFVYRLMPSLRGALTHAAPPAPARFTPGSVMLTTPIRHFPCFRPRLFFHFSIMPARRFAHRSFASCVVDECRRGAERRLLDIDQFKIACFSWLCPPSSLSVSGLLYTIPPPFAKTAIT